MRTRMKSKRLISILLTLAMAVNIIPIVSIPTSASPGTQYSINNPYANVVWSGSSAWKQYKAALHTHSQHSDGKDSVRSMAEEHYRQGFHIVSITDHNRVNIAPNLTPPNSTNPESSVLSRTRMSEMEAGTGTSSDVRPDNRGMIFVPSSNERSGLSFPEIDAVANKDGEGHHFNTYWTDTGNRSETVHSMLGKVADAGAGLSVANHPGRNTDAYFPGNSFSQSETISKKPSIYTPYTNLFKNNNNLVAMEIINKFDGESQGDRVLWDMVLSQLMPEGRNVWGSSTDDSHRNMAIGYSFNMMLMPELSLSEFRNSLETGAFFAFSRVDRQLGHGPSAYSGISSNSTVRGDSLSQSTADGIRNLSMPTVTNIVVSESAGTITITTDSSSNNTVKWWTDGGKMIHTGTTLTLNNYDADIKSYVRATVERSGRGVLYTQPFGIQKGTPRALPTLQSISPVADVSVSADAHKTEMGLSLPGGTQITVRRNSTNEVRPATIIWNLKSAVNNSDGSMTVPGTVKLNGILNPNNISTAISIKVKFLCNKCEPRTEVIWEPNLPSLTVNNNRTLSGGAGVWTESSSAAIALSSGTLNFTNADNSALSNRNLLIASTNEGTTSGWNSTGGFTGVPGVEYRFSFSGSVNSGTREVDIGANRIEIEDVSEDDDGNQITKKSWVDGATTRVELTTTPKKVSLTFVYDEGRIRIGSRTGTSTRISITEPKIEKILAYCHGNCDEHAKGGPETVDHEYKWGLSDGTFIGNGNWIREYNIDASQRFEIINSVKSTLDFTFSSTFTSTRRLWAWTDLTGSPDTTMVVAANLTTNPQKIAQTTTLTGSYSSASITIPKSMLYNEGTKQFATKIYVIATTTNTNPGDPTSGSSELRNDLTAIISSMKITVNGVPKDGACLTHVGNCGSSCSNSGCNVTIKCNLNTCPLCNPCGNGLHNFPVGCETECSRSGCTVKSAKCATCVNCDPCGNGLHNFPVGCEMECSRSGCTVKSAKCGTCVNCDPCGNGLHTFPVGCETECSRSGCTVKSAKCGTCVNCDLCGNGLHTFPIGCEIECSRSGCTVKSAKCGTCVNCDPCVNGEHIFTAGCETECSRGGGCTAKGPKCNICPSCDPCGNGIHDFPIGCEMKCSRLGCTVKSAKCGSCTDCDPCGNNFHDFPVGCETTCKNNNCKVKSPECQLPICAVCNPCTGGHKGTQCGTNCTHPSCNEIYFCMSIGCFDCDSCSQHIYTTGKCGEVCNHPYCIVPFDCGLCDACGYCRICLKLDCGIIHYGHIVGNKSIGIGDALQILMYMAGMENSMIVKGGQGSRPWNASLITNASRVNNKPSINDVLQILMYMAYMPSELGQRQ